MTNTSVAILKKHGNEHPAGRNMMRKATWKIIDRGSVPKISNHIEYHCCDCGHDADLPVLGLARAQIGQGVVFDIGKRAVPKIIQCRKCRRRFESVDPE